MNENQIKALIKRTALKKYADGVFDNPINILKMIDRIAQEYEVCIDLQAELYERGCFNNAELMEEFDYANTEMQLYKIILAELPKYL